MNTVKKTLKKRNKKQIHLPYATKPGFLPVCSNTRIYPFSCFKFRHNWNMVLPHLHSEAVENALDDGIRLFYLLSEGNYRHWKSGDPIWKLDGTGFWDDIVEEKISRLYPGWEEKYKHPSDSRYCYKLREVYGYRDEYLPAYYDEKERIRDLCGPKKDTPEFYQAFDMQYYLAGWHGMLGRKLFPAYKWFVAHKTLQFNPQSYENKCFTLVIGKHPNIREFIIFDILNFSKSPVNLLKIVNEGFVFTLDEWTESVAERVNK